MKSHYRLLSFLSVALIIAQLVSPLVFAKEELVDRIVAAVNDEVITQSELDALFRPVAEQFKGVYQGQELMEKLTEARSKLLSQLIEDKLVLLEANKLGLEATESEVNERLDELKGQFPDDQTFQKALEDQQVTLTSLRKRLADQVVIQKLHYIEIRQKIIVSPTEVKDYYDSNPDQFQEKEKVEVWSITIRKSDDAIRKGMTDEAAKKKAEAALKSLKSGKDFSEVAKKESSDSHAATGGLIGNIGKGDLIDKIDDVIFKLEPDQFSDILETEQAYLIFKAGVRQPEKKLLLEEAKDQISDFLFRQKASVRFKEWMQQLRKKAYISIR